MNKNKYSFESFQFSSPIIRDLIAEKSTISPWVNAFFSLDKLTEQTQHKSFGEKERALLVDRLKKQNQEIKLSESTLKNIDLLQEENTFTITTGHQLNLLTGPLYSIYKVAEVIALTTAKNKADDQYHYVPVFWMATEDHDFEEINHIHLFGQKIAWEKENQEDYIAGRITTESIADFTEQIKEKYQDESIQAVLDEILGFYVNTENLADATRGLMNHLFADYGLVIIDGDDKDLKQSFVNVAKKEIEEQFVHQAVSKQNEALEKAGYHQQVYLRNCNLFYINESGKRERIAFENDTFLIGDREVSKANLLTELASFPERFSPNALLRPVYQELILPNLAYVGGGGEIAYWLQLKPVFDAIDLTYPLLRVRDSILLISDRDEKDMDELELSVLELKKETHALIKEIALNETEVEVELVAEKEALQSIQHKVMEKASAISNGMESMIAAEFTKMEHGISRLESKLIKAEKSKHDKAAKKIKKLKQKFYPNGGFQERFDNFLPHFLRNHDFVKEITNNLEATDEPHIHIVKL